MQVGAGASTPSTLLSWMMLSILALLSILAPISCRMIIWKEIEELQLVAKYNNIQVQHGNMEQPLNTFESIRQSARSINSSSSQQSTSDLEECILKLIPTPTFQGLKDRHNLHGICWCLTKILSQVALHILQGGSSTFQAFLAGLRAGL